MAVGSGALGGKSPAVSQSRCGQPLVPTGPRSLVQIFSNNSVLAGAPLRNRTVDLLLTITMASRTMRASCTDGTRNCTDRTRRAGIIRRTVPRPVPRAGPYSNLPPPPTPWSTLDRWLPAALRRVKVITEKCTGIDGHIPLRGDPPCMNGTFKPPRSSSSRIGVFKRFRVGGRVSPIFPEPVPLKSTSAAPGSLAARST